MDQPDVLEDQLAQALAGLRRVNFWSAAAASMWPPIAQLADREPSRRLTLLDVATGGGDVPVALWRRAQRAGLELAIQATDRNPKSLVLARHYAEQAGAPIIFNQMDALTEELPEVDIVTCSLFMHHLADEEAQELLGRMGRAARRLLLVNDLRRNGAGEWLARIATRFLSRSAIVHVDGPRSARAAFTTGEMQSLARQAGLDNATVRPIWPCRMLMEWQPE